MHNKPYLIELPKITDPRGNLTFLENTKQIPFDIQRVFWTYDVPGGGIRGGHSYKTQDEFIIALSGSFDIIITKPDKKKERITLNRSYYGYYLPALTWRHIENFSTNALALHVSNRKFDQSDYIRDWEEYLKLRDTKWKKIS